MSEISGTPKTIRVGLVAFGLSGRVFHAPFLISHPKFELVAVYERGLKTEALKFCTENNYCRRDGSPIEIVRSCEQLCGRDDIDLVVVCSPIEFHFEHAKTALTAGRHVLVEKAFCSTAAQAMELVGMARSLGLICVPYQNRQFDSDFLTLRALIESDTLGEIIEYNGFYNRWSPNIRAGVWKDTVQGSGGNFRSLGSHMIDQAVALFGIPQKIWADIQCQREGGILDDAWEVHLYYSKNDSIMDAGESGVRKHGFKAILKGSLLCLDHDIRYMVHGRKGSWVKKGVDLQEERIMSGNMPTYPTGCVQREPEHLWGTLTGLDGSRILTPTSVSSYHFLYDSLYSSIIDCTRPFISGANVIAVIKLINMAFESSRLGAVLPV